MPISRTSQLEHTLTDDELTLDFVAETDNEEEEIEDDETVIDTLDFVTDTDRDTLFEIDFDPETLEDEIEDDDLVALRLLQLELVLVTETEMLLLDDEYSV